MGELICERAGVLNLGIEGIMTAGAFAGWFTVYAGGDLWTGVAVAALAGAAFGLLHATLTVPLGLSQHVVGIGVTLLATSLTYYHLPPGAAGGDVAAEDRAVRSRWPIPGLSDIPVVGEALFAQTPLTYLAFVAVGRRRLGALPHAARPGDPRRRREPVGRRGAGHQRHRPSASARSWPAAR